MQHFVNVLCWKVRNFFNVLCWKVWPKTGGTLILDTVLVSSAGWRPFGQADGVYGLVLMTCMRHDRGWRSTSTTHFEVSNLLNNVHQVHFHHHPICCECNSYMCIYIVKSMYIHWNRYPSFWISQDFSRGCFCVKRGSWLQTLISNTHVGCNVPGTCSVQ